MFPLAFLSAAILPALAVASAVPQPGEIKTFKNWAVGCDNGLACQAVSLVDENRGYDDWDGPFTIVRTADERDILKISAHVEANEMDRYRIYVDGRLVDTGPINEGDYSIEIVGQDAKKVARAIIRGNRLVVKGPEGKNLTTISLAGSAAALRYMDARQKRAYTRTALVAKGRRAYRAPETSVPMIPVKRWEASKDIPETSEIVALAEGSKCKEDRFGVIEDQAYPLGQRDEIKRALVLVSCGSGAYNFSSTPFIGIRDGAADAKWRFEPAKFDLNPSWSGAGRLPLLVNAHWDEKTQILASFAKGRGLGDCGNAESYIWDGEQFRLIEASGMNECRGAYEWITTWRANHTADAAGEKQTAAAQK